MHNYHVSLLCIIVIDHIYCVSFYYNVSLLCIIAMYQYHIIYHYYVSLLCIIIMYHCFISLYVSLLCTFIYQCVLLRIIILGNFICTVDVDGKYVYLDDLCTCSSEILTAVSSWMFSTCTISYEGYSFMPHQTVKFASKLNVRCKLPKVYKKKYMKSKSDERDQIVPRVRACC